MVEIADFFTTRERRDSFIIGTIEDTCRYINSNRQERVRLLELIISYALTCKEITFLNLPSELILKHYPYKICVNRSLYVRILIRITFISSPY